MGENLLEALQRLRANVEEVKRLSSSAFPALAPVPGHPLFAPPTIQPSSTTSAKDIFAELNAPKEDSRFGRRPVGWSHDLQRISELPRRVLDLNDQGLADRWSLVLRQPVEKCDCVEKWGFCIRQLLPIQALALEDAYRANGLVAPIAVGAGKFGISVLLPWAIPGCQRAVLLIPPNLRAQFFGRDWPQWSVHFKLPNLAHGRTFISGRPALHVVAYSELSSPKSSALLEQIQPDTIICDEGHYLASKDAARTSRFLRYFRDHPETRLCVLSGTITDKSIKEYAHLMRFSLRQGTPLPLHWPTVEEWAGALDPERGSMLPAPAGRLATFCRPGEHVREGFQRRLVETVGVVATAEGMVKQSLIIASRKPAPVPPADIAEKAAQVRNLWQRPDGEELTDILTRAAVAREMACGFFYRWTWPRGENADVIREWLAARKEWHQELREKLKRPVEQMDSPLLATNAAIRWHEGFVEVLAPGLRIEHPPHTKHPLTWASGTWLHWQAVKDTCSPQSEAVWVSDYLVRDSVEWGRSHVGIIWYQHDAFGQAVAKLGSFPLFGAGEKASQSILQEKGARTIVASVKAHGTGKNLQHAFSVQLVANPPSSGKVWEQLLGRTHRQGQRADEVVCEVYQHTIEMREALEQAQAFAQYVAQTTGNAQKLCYANYSL